MDFEWTNVLTANTSLTSVEFRNSLEVWNKKPHLLNKKVSGTKVLQNSTHSSLSFFNALRASFHEDLSNFEYSAAKEDALAKLEKLTCPDHESCSQESRYKITVKILYPKNPQRRTKLVEISLFDELRNSMCFFPSGIGPRVNYGFIYDKERISLLVEERDVESEGWLKNALWPSLDRWGKMEAPKLSSLSLVPEDDYCLLYNELKAKYGNKLREIWVEKTDPMKFIYEDINIAAYLILLWRRQKVKFVDLGCGNGLLVHILNSEGHSGVGIDVRSRKIWELYPPSTRLEVDTIRPSESSLFPEAEWIIGNHSDELTPWIPVIAARSSYSCNFFLLPCCAYDFSGQKYQRKNSSLSQYEDYLNHVRWLADECGFQTRMDKLRIPSTKRICIISDGRVYHEPEIDHFDKKISTLISQSSGEEWIEDFTPRQGKEAVRNCTQLKVDFLQSIVLKIARILLQGGSGAWNAGSRLSLEDLAQLLSREDLKTLKNEHGGLKTLLRNHSFVFRVEKGFVELRKPMEGRAVEARNWKKSHCWFFLFHPQSCPLENGECSFIHEGGKRVAAQVLCS